MTEQNSTQKSGGGVQLGCGTLILIALIVMTFSGGSKVENLERNVNSLRTEIRQLRESIEALSRQLGDTNALSDPLEGPARIVPPEAVPPSP